MRQDFQEDKYYSYNDIVKIIAAKRNISVTLVRRILNNFFGKHGLKYYVNKNIDCQIYKLGKFYKKPSKIKDNRKRLKYKLAMKSLREKQSKNKLRINL